MDIKVKNRMLEIAGLPLMESKAAPAKVDESLKESIGDTYNIGNAIEFYLGLYDDMSQDSDTTDPEDFTAPSVEEYLRDMITDELEQALQDPQVKRRIIQVVGSSRQNAGSPEQRTLPV